MFGTGNFKEIIIFFNVVPKIVGKVKNFLQTFKDKFR